MEIKAIELIGQTQTEDQKKQQREKITKLMLNPIQEAEKELIGASSCQHLFKYVSPIEKELEREALSRKHNQELLQKSQERITQQQQNHKQMLIDVQVEAMRKFEAEKQQVNVDAGKGSNAGTETQPINQNSNSLDFSGLLNNPIKKDDWFCVIDDMTRAFHTEFGKIPNEPQAWGALWANSPEGYEITTGKSRGEDCLIMQGANPLSKKAFSKRWKNYTNKA